MRAEAAQRIPYGISGNRRGKHAGMGIANSYVERMAWREEMK